MLIGHADGVNTFQGKKTGVVQQFKMNYSPRILGIHYMVRIGLVVTSSFNSCINFFRSVSVSCLCACLYAHIS